MARQEIPVSQNLLLQSNTFSNGSWGKVNSSITSGASDPLGGTTAFSLVEDSNTGYHQISQAKQYTPIAGRTYTYSVYCKQGTRRYMNLSPYSGTFAYFDLQAGAVGSNSGFPTGFNPVLSIQSMGSGWYLCSLTFTVTSTATIGSFTNYITASDTDGGTTYTGVNGNTAIQIWRAQFSQGTRVLPYVDTTTAVYDVGTTRNLATGRAAASNRAAINNGTKAFGTFTISDYQYLAGKQTSTAITITDYTLMAGGNFDFLSGTFILTEGVDFDSETSNDVTAVNIADAINVEAGGTVATVVGAVITIALPGDNDGSTVVWSGTGVSPTTATFTGGYDVTKVTLDATDTFFGDGGVDPGNSNDEAATNLGAALAAFMQPVDIFVSNNIVTVVYDTIGTAGNSYAISVSGLEGETPSGGCTASGATLSGGSNATNARELIIQ